MILPNLHGKFGANDAEQLRKIKSFRIDPFSLDYPEGHSYWKVISLIQHSEIDLDRINIVDINKLYSNQAYNEAKFNSFNMLGDTFYDYEEFFFTFPISFGKDFRYHCNEHMLPMYILHEVCHYYRAKILNSHLKSEVKDSVKIETMTNFGLVSQFPKLTSVKDLIEDHLSSFVSTEPYDGDFDNQIEVEACYLQAYIQKELEIFPYDHQDNIHNEPTQVYINEYLSITGNGDLDEDDVLAFGNILYDELTKIGTTFNMA